MCLFPRQRHGACITHVALWATGVSSYPVAGAHACRCAGAIVGNADLVATVRAMHNVLGGTIDPHAAWLLLRGMKTLGLRVERQNKTAFEIARRFASLPLNLLPEQC